jgi:prepilin-type N-terminal cleavage/methylation domain-containing protein
MHQLQAKRYERAFTLIELLVVISIIAVLASLMLPTLARAKEKSKTTVCLNNLHQIGLCLAMYNDENSYRFPEAQVRDGDTMKMVEYTLGGREAKPSFAAMAPSAKVRPLYPFVKESEIFKCPRDRGQFGSSWHGESLEFKPNNWEALGCSYRYNTVNRRRPGQPSATRKPQADPFDGIAGKTISWVPNPSLYILVHEPPAKRYEEGEGMFFHWHFCEGKVMVPYKDVRNDGAKFISPILFVDGHTAIHDFSKVIKASPDYPYEPTEKWVWYKAADE